MLDYKAHNKAVLDKLRGILKRANDKQIDLTVLHSANLLKHLIITTKLRGQVLQTHDGGAGLMGAFYVEGSRARYVLGNRKVYAAIQEFGGEIHAVNGKYLRFVYKGEFKTVKKVVIPERSYVRSTIREKWDYLMTDAANYLWRKIDEETT